MGRRGRTGRSFGKPRRSGSRTEAASEPIVEPPEQVAGLQGWYKADAIEGLSDADPVATWVDASENHDLSQATPGKRPTFETAVVNGKPVVRFVATDAPTDVQWVGTTDLAIDVRDPLTVISVFALSATDNSVFGFSYWDGTPDPGIAAVSDSYTWDDSGIVLAYDVGESGGTTPTRAVEPSPGQRALDEFGVFAMRWSGLELRTYEAGVLLGTSSDPEPFSALTMERLVLGGSSMASHADVSTAEAAWLTGDIAEFIYYEEELADADLNLVGNYLADKYALSWTEI